MASCSWLIYLGAIAFGIASIYSLFALYRGILKSRSTASKRLPVRFFLHLGLFSTLILEMANCIYLALDPSFEKHVTGSFCKQSGIGNGEDIDDWVYNILSVFPAAFNLTTYSILIQMFIKIHYTNHSTFAKMFSKFFIIFNLLIYLSFISIAIWTGLSQNYGDMYIYPGYVVSIWNILLSLCFIYFYSRLRRDLRKENEFQSNTNFSRLTKRTLILCYVIAVFALLRGIYGILLQFYDVYSHGNIPVAVWRSIVHAILFIPPAVITVSLTMPKAPGAVQDETLLWPEADAMDSEETMENLCQPYFGHRETNTRVDSDGEYQDRFCINPMS